MSRDVQALNAALAAEHRVIYGYGVVGSRLNGQRPLSMTLWQAHKTRRDELISLITGLNGSPVASDPAYSLPATQPTLLAATLEEELVTAYLPLAGAASAKLRALAAQAMQEAMIHTVRWSRKGPDTPFPGLRSDQLTPSPEP